MGLQISFLGKSKSGSITVKAFTHQRHFCSLKKNILRTAVFSHRMRISWCKKANVIFFRPIFTKLSCSKQTHQLQCSYDNDGWLVICVCDKQGIPKCILFDEEVKLSLSIWSCAQNFLFFSWKARWKQDIHHKRISLFVPPSMCPVKTSSQINSPMFLPQIPVAAGAESFDPNISQIL